MINLKEERNQIFEDIYINNKIPSRMPSLGFALSHFMFAQWKGIDPVEAQFNLDVLTDSIEEITEIIKSDTCPIPPSARVNRNPAGCQLLGSRIYVMGKSGLLQRPEVEGMFDDEYDSLIEDPYSFLCNVVIPRLYTNLDAKNPMKAYTTLMRADFMTGSYGANYNKKLFEVINKKEYWVPPKNFTKLTVAPFDYLSDNVRGFTGMSKDLRRHRSQIREACEAVLPILFKLGMPEKIDGFSKVRTALHMPPYMRQKDFEDLWLPTYKTMLEQYAARGIRMSCFCENDWTRYLDYLLELPTGTEIMFEYGDPKEIKNKLGHKFIIKGLYPLSLLKTGTKQEVLDKAKELLDTMLPGGGYIFEFDKIPVSLNDINFENYVALSEFVYDYAKYDNASEKAITGELNCEKFEVKDMSFTSKGLFNWDELKSAYPVTPETARQRFEACDDKMFSSLLSLLI